MSSPLDPIRCMGRKPDGSQCNQLLCEHSLQSGMVRIKCGKCNTWTVIVAVRDNGDNVGPDPPPRHGTDAIVAP